MGKAPVSSPSQNVDHPQLEAGHRADALLALAHVATLVLLGIAVWIFLTYTTGVGAAVASLTGIR